MQSKQDFRYIKETDLNPQLKIYEEIKNMYLDVGYKCTMKRKDGSYYNKYDRFHIKVDMFEGKIDLLKRILSDKNISGVQIQYYRVWKL